MKTFAIFLVILVASSTRAQEDENDEVCADLNDGDLVGFGHDVSCSKYWYCQDGIGYASDCLDENEEYQFNEETYQCDWNDVVNCVENNEPQTEPPITDEPVPLPPVTQAPTTPPPGSVTDDPSLTDIECPTNRPGEILFFPSSNCSNYFICANGVRAQMTCLEGFAWNNEEKQCDFPIYSACSRTSSIDGQGNVQCRRQGFYNTEYPRDCTKFVFCAAGVPMTQNCPQGTAWSVDRCVDRRFATCTDLRRLNQ